jgi:O-antigen ligase
VSLPRRVVAWFLELPPETPLAILMAFFWYNYHVFCAGWVASSEVGATFAMAATIVALWRREFRFVFHILYFPLIVYGIASTLSAVFSGSEHAFGESALWGKMLLFPTALILYRNVPQSREFVLRWMLRFAVFASGWALFQYFILGERDLDHRITGPAAHVMTLSGLLLPIALIYLVLWMHDRKNWWLLGGAAMTSLTLLLTFTRSVWLGWLIAVGVLFVLKRPRALIIAVPALLIFVSFLPMSLFTRAVSTFDTRQSSNLDRIRMAEAGVEIIRDHPLLGVGPGNIKEAYPLYRRHDAPRFRIPHLHNNLIQLWAERGVLAPIAYLLLLGLLLRECWRAWRGPEARWAEIGVAVTVALFVAGLFEFNFGDTEVFWVLLDIYALVISFIARNLSTDARVTATR